MPSSISTTTSSVLISQKIVTDLHLNITLFISSTRMLLSENRYYSSSTANTFITALQQFQLFIDWSTTPFVSLFQLVLAAPTPTGPCRINVADSTSTGLYQPHICNSSSPSTANWYPLINADEYFKLSNLTVLTLPNSKTVLTLTKSKSTCIL